MTCAPRMLTRSQAIFFGLPPRVGGVRRHYLQHTWAHATNAGAHLPTPGGVPPPAVDIGAVGSGRGAAGPCTLWWPEACPARRGLCPGTET